jgi:uncharacterized protein
VSVRNVIEIGQIRDLSERIAREFRPERIILFGSYAYGTPASTSDVDLLVILPFEGKAVHKAVEILNATEPTFPVDLLVRTPSEVEQRLALNDFFMREIMEKGRVLHAAAHG